MVVFEAGERKKSVEVVITDDEEVEKEREVVALSLTGGDQTVLTPYPHTLIAITDDDGELHLNHLIYAHSNRGTPLHIIVKDMCKPRAALTQVWSTLK